MLNDTLSSLGKHASGAALSASQVANRMRPSYRLDFSLLAHQPVHAAVRALRAATEEGAAAKPTVTTGREEVERGYYVVEYDVSC